MKTLHAILNDDGTYKLAEPIESSGKQQHVLVALVEQEDEAYVGGVRNNRAYVESGPGLGLATA